MPLIFSGILTILKENHAVNANVLYVYWQITRAEHVNFSDFENFLEQIGHRTRLK